MPDAQGKPTIGDAFGAVDSRMRKLEQTLASKEQEAEESRARAELSSATLKHLNTEFNLTGDQMITPDTEGLDYSDPTKFYHSATAVAAKRIRPTQSNEDSEEDDSDEEDDAPLTARRLERAIGRVMGGGTTSSPRPTAGHRTVTVEDVRAAAEMAGGRRGMAASIAATKELNRRAESDPKTQRFLSTQSQSMRR